MTDATLLCLGHAALDRIYRIAAFPPTPRKVVANGFTEVGGGMAANAAVAAARLGGRVRFIGKVGADAAGAVIRAGLEAEGVDCTGLIEVPGARTPTSAVIVDAAGERLLVNDPGTGLDLPGTLIDLNLLDGARAVLVDVRWPAGAMALLAAARARGIATLLDADIRAGDALPGLLALADEVWFSAPGLAEFAPGLPAEAALAAARRASPAIAGVTQGAEGCLWLDGAGTHRRAAFPVATQDTSGAGDAFHGAYAWALAARLELEQRIDTGQAAAALKCLAPGNRAGLPDRAALEAFLRARR